MHAQARWYSFHFLVHQLVEALDRLRVTLNLMLPRLPGAHIQPSSHIKGALLSMRYPCWYWKESYFVWSCKLSTSLRWCGVGPPDQAHLAKNASGLLWSIKPYC